MKCDRCENEATVHEVMIKGGKKQERHLCEKCARQHGVSIVPSGGASGGPPIAQLLSQFISQPASSGGAASASGAGAPSGQGTGTPGAHGSKPITICPSCGLAFAQFRNNGLLGCGTCYAAFEGLLSPMLARAHEGGTHHVGRMPRSVSDQPPSQASSPAASLSTGTQVPGESKSTSAPMSPGTSDSRAAAASDSPASAAPKPAAAPHAKAAPKKPASGAGAGAHSPRAKPKSIGSAPDPAKLQDALRQQLKDAIEAEQYERAASLRDELAKLTGKAPGPRGEAIDAPRSRSTPGSAPGDEGHAGKGGSS